MTKFGIEILVQAFFFLMCVRNILADHVHAVLEDEDMHQSQGRKQKHP